MHGTVKLWRWRRNPLRRRSDVMEAWAGLAVAVVVAVGAPITGVAAANGMHDSLEQANHDRHHATAVLVHDAPSDARAHSDGLSPTQVRGDVRWHTADGGTRTAKVVVATGARAGSTLPVWLDGADRLTDPPLDALQTAVQTDIMGGGAAFGFCLVALASHRVVRAGLDRGRYARWQREWAQVGPQWSRGHRT